MPALDTTYWLGLMFSRVKSLCSGMRNGCVVFGLMQWQLVSILLCDKPSPPQAVSVAVAARVMDRYR